MAQQLNRSVFELRQIISAFFQTNLPPYIVQARNDWGLSEYQLPLPKKYDAVDPNLMTEYPFIGAYFPADDNYVRTDYSAAMEEEYWASYSTRIFCSVTTPKRADGLLEEPQYEATVRLRDDMTELMKQALLAFQTLGQPSRCRIEETSLQVNRIDPTRITNQNAAFSANGIIALNIRHRLELSRRPLGTSNEIELEIGVVPAGEEMP